MIGRPDGARPVSPCRSRALPRGDESPRSSPAAGTARGPARRDAQDSRPWVASYQRTNCRMRSEEHTSELQSRLHLVCRLLLEKKKKKMQRVKNANRHEITNTDMTDE